MINRATRKLKEYNVIEKEWECPIFRDEAAQSETLLEGGPEDLLQEEIMRKSDSEESDDHEEDLHDISDKFHRRNKCNDEFANQFELMMKKRTKEIESQQSQMTYLSQMS